MDDMIYVFNSAFRPLYLHNVLNTLFLPNGSTNEYRYTLSENLSHVSPSLESSISELKREQPVAISYIDRFSPTGYQYYPLRLGKLVSIRQIHQRVYIRVELADFVYPQSIDRFFAERMTELQNKGAPKLTDDNPKNTKDGYYALLHQNIFISKGEYEWGESPGIQSSRPSQRQKHLEINPWHFLRPKFKTGMEIDYPRAYLKTILLPLTLYVVSDIF